MIADLGQNLISNACDYFYRIVWFIEVPSKLNDSLVIASKRAVAGT